MVVGGGGRWTGSWKGYRWELEEIRCMLDDFCTSNRR